MAVYQDGRKVEQAPAEATLACRSAFVDEASVSAFLAGKATPRIVWTPPEGPAVAAAGGVATITAEGPARFREVRDGAAAVFNDVDVPDDSPPAARPRLYGGFSFHPAHGGSPPWDGFPAARFVVPRIQLIRTRDGAMLAANAFGVDAPARAAESLRNAKRSLGDASPPSAAAPPGIVDRHRIPDRAGWRTVVETALDRISSGSLSKVVLAQSLRATLGRSIDPPATLARLGKQYPKCTRFLFSPADGAAMFGATPERLVSLRGRTVETEALAGSIGRGDTPTEDEVLARSLTASDKDRHEHELVADAISDQLDPFAASVTTGEQRLRRLDSVQHLETEIKARLADDRHVLTLVEALHPTPAVGGLPPDAAQATIREAEPFDRGWYAGPIGWFDARGNGTFVVGIRSAVARGRTATLIAGAGIVADSDPDAEWEEVQLKYRPVLDALER